MRHGVTVDTGERPRVSAPGVTRQDRSDGPDETRSMPAMWAKRGTQQPQPSPRVIGIIGHDSGRMRRGEGGHVRRRPKTPPTSWHCCVRRLVWPLDFTSSSHNEPPRYIGSFPRGFSLPGWLAGGGLGSVIAPRGHSHGHSWAQPLGASRAEP